jgi:hypothetical protein
MAAFHKSVNGANIFDPDLLVLVAVAEHSHEMTLDLLRIHWDFAWAGSGGKFWRIFPEFLLNENKICKVASGDHRGIPPAGRDGLQQCLLYFDTLVVADHTVRTGSWGPAWNGNWLARDLPGNLALVRHVGPPKHDAPVPLKTEQPVAVQGGRQFKATRLALLFQDLVGVLASL